MARRSVPEAPSSHALWAGLLAAVALVVVGCGSSAEQTSTAASVATTAPAEEPATVAPSTPAVEESLATSAETETTTVAETVFTPGEVVERQIGDRTYLLYTGASYDQSTPAALVLDLHAPEQSPWSSLARTKPLADQTGAVFAYPATIPQSPWDTDSDADAVFVGQVLDDIDQLLDIDQDRIYAIGHSNGGTFSTFLPCHLGSRLAGVVTNAFLIHHDQDACGANEPIDVLAIVGEFDEFTNLGETYIRDVHGGHGPYPGPWTDEIVKFADTNSCESAFAETTDDDGTLHRVYTCADARLEVYRFPGGHVWAGTGQHTVAVGEFEANEVLWDFLEPTTP